MIAYALINTDNGVPYIQKHHIPIIRDTVARHEQSARQKVYPLNKTSTWAVYHSQNDRTAWDIHPIELIRITPAGNGGVTRE